MSDYVITCGEHNQKTRDQYEITMPVTSVIQHPNYGSALDGYDIAIFKVRRTCCKE